MAHGILLSLLFEWLSNAASEKKTHKTNGLGLDMGFMVLATEFDLPPSSSCFQWSLEAVVEIIR